MIRYLKSFALFILFMMFSLSQSKGQVLISLLLGDKLNSGKLEFGLDGGANFSMISNVPEAKTRIGFHLGFYFDFRLNPNEKLYIHTGVIVKSPMGVSGLSPYSLGNADLDSALVASEVKRKLSYFNVPIVLKYKFYKHYFVEVGPQLGLLHKAKDEFTTSISNGDLTFVNNVRDNYHRIDAGLLVGAGYRLFKGHGMNLGVRYYLGMVDILKDNPSGIQRNSSFYIFAGIPIGAGKKPVSNEPKPDKEKKKEK